MRHLYFKGFAALVLGVAACQTEGPSIEEVSFIEEVSSIEEASLLGVDILNTFGSDYIQIDKLNLVPGADGSPADANLFLGPDPADGTASVDFPPGPGPFIDWNDLAAAGEDNFIFEDASLAKDPSSFPRSNECVGPSTVLSKMDLTYAGAYNNMDYAYFVVQRSDNSGDAAYYWLFTKLEPSTTLGEAPCRTTEQRLMYTISEGDILFSGHFKPSASVPLLRVFTANAASSGRLTAVDAINFNSGLWTEDNSIIEAIAVNTTITQPGALGYAGVKRLLNGDAGVAIGPELIAEIAVNTSIFTGGQPCGATFFGSVISRSSGAGGTTPDLKDLIGPALFNFGDITAEATLVSSCEPGAQFGAIGFAMDGSPLVNPTCSWDFGDGVTSNLCDGFVGLAPGARTGTLTLTDPGTGCAATIDTAPVDVYAAIEATADLVPTCALSFSYLGDATGGSGSFTYEWEFSGAGVVTPSTSNTANGTADVSVGNTLYTADLTVTDLRPDGLLCQAFASDTGTPYAPLAVNLTPSALAPICSSNDDSVTYYAHPSGGQAPYTFTWTGVDGCSGDSCTINPANDDFCAETSLSVSVDDSSTLCNPEDSETESYAKVTIINASDN